MLFLSIWWLLCCQMDNRSKMCKIRARVQPDAESLWRPDPTLLWWSVKLKILLVVKNPPPCTHFHLNLPGSCRLYFFAWGEIHMKFKCLLRIISLALPALKELEKSSRPGTSWWPIVAILFPDLSIDVVIVYSFPASSQQK